MSERRIISGLVPKKKKTLKKVFLVDYFLYSLVDVVCLGIY